ncbi:MAG: sigma-70 family RNA polymerase sigma factor [Tepidisphaeraceae bacterium]
MEEEVEQLVRAAAGRGARGEKAFVELIRRFEAAALAAALGICGRGDDAGEVTQEAFLRAWKGIGRLRQPERFGGWILEIVRNLALDRAGRQARFEGEVAEELADPRGIDPATALQHEDSQRQLRAALAELDDLSRQIVMLRYYQTLSSREIGETLNLSPAAVDMRLSRARQTLREKLAAKEAGAQRP